MAGVDGPKVDRADVATASLAGDEAGSIEVLVDDAARFVRTALAGRPGPALRLVNGNSHEENLDESRRNWG